MLRKWMRLFSVITLVLFIPSTIFCQTALLPKSQDSDHIYVSITGIDGSVVEKTGSINEFLGFSNGYLPELIVDGYNTTNPAMVVTGNLVETQLLQGKAVRLQRSGNKLYRLDTNSSTGTLYISSVRWNQDLTTLELTYSTGETSIITIRGMNTIELKARYIGYLSVSLLSEDDIERHADEPYQESRFACGGWCIALAIAALGYAGCVAFGPGICANAARNACGNNNVAASKVICGSGYDQEGNFQLGYGCANKCK